MVSTDTKSIDSIKNKLFVELISLHIPIEVDLLDYSGIASNFEFVGQTNKLSIIGTMVLVGSGGILTQTNVNPRTSMVDIFRDIIFL